MKTINTAIAIMVTLLFWGQAGAQESLVDKYNLIENENTEVDTTCGENQSLNPFIGVCTCNAGFIFDQGQCVGSSVSSVVENKVISPNYSEDNVYQAPISNAASKTPTPGDKEGATTDPTKKVGPRSPSVVSSLQTSVFKRKWNDSSRGYVKTIDGTCGGDHQVVHENQKHCVCDTGFIMINEACVTTAEYNAQQDTILSEAYKRKTKKSGKGGFRGFFRKRW